MAGRLSLCLMVALWLCMAGKALAQGGGEFSPPQAAFFDDSPAAAPVSTVSPVIRARAPDSDSYGRGDLSSGVVAGIGDDWLRTDADLSYGLLSFQNRQTDKELLLLDAWKNAGPGGPLVWVGGQARGSALWATTNRTDRFSYLGRFPGDFTGDSATDLRLLQGNTHLTVRAADWAGFYGELLFSDVFTFPAFNQGSLQARQAFVLFGDLNRSPFYGWIGKKNTPFGDMQSLNPFSQAMTWHYFGGLAEGGGVGYRGEFAEFSVAGLNGGRGIRVVDSVRRGKLNNLAANGALVFGRGEPRTLRLGAGYLRGTIYDSTPAEHTNPGQFGAFYNSAWDVNSRLDLGPLSLAAEYVTTLRDWPVTGHPVAAYRTEAALALPAAVPSYVSVGWSEGIQGPAGSQFEFNRQLVLGLGTRVHRNAFVSIEYVRSIGFAPLINITTVSDRDVVQNSLVLGIDLFF